MNSSYASSKKSSKQPSKKSPKCHQKNNNGEGTKEENKIFENSLGDLDVSENDLFEKIAIRLPGKTVEQIKIHYEALVKDIERIELGEFDHLIK
uniref:Myb-like domain-containing protein n=1 Tax=Chenopodium quinoa TaxID=63459 RepID=A0A803N0G0_CHEQI